MLAEEPETEEELLGSRDGEVAGTEEDLGQKRSCWDGRPGTEDLLG
jgi:hypothetical protein